MFNKEKIFKKAVFRLKENIKKWGGEKVLVYGAGQHSTDLLKEIEFSPGQLLGFVDKSELRQKEGFLNCPVFSPKAIKATGASKIIISSFSFQEEIYQELSCMNLSNIELVKVYEEQDQLEFIKERYACCPPGEGIRSSVQKHPEKYILPIDRSTDSHQTKILLIQPPLAVANPRHKRILPMNLLYIAGFLKKHNPDAVVRILDGQVSNLNMNEMKHLISQDIWDIIGIGYWTIQASFAIELSKFIKAKTDSFLVHGGVHPTVCPEDAGPYSDLMLLHEGEETFSELVMRYQQKENLFDISGTAYQTEDGIKINPSRDWLYDLDEIPFPLYELIPDMTAYDSPMHVVGGLRVPLIGSRGCPYSCTFCSSPLIWNKKVRFRNPLKIVDEMEHVIKSTGIDQFHFWDDNLLLKPDYMRAISEEILKRGLKINWCGLTRASHVNKHKDILPLMRQSGCVGIEIGIESFTDEATELVRKEEGVSEMIDASRNMEEAGIVPLYTHMILNPGENINGYLRKQDFLDEINARNPHYLADSRLGQAATPHRKTEFERVAKDLGKFYMNTYSDYFHHRINFIPNSLLNDIPVKSKASPETPLKFLEIIVQAIFDWDAEMIDQYVDVYSKAWERIDGKKRVIDLCGEVRSDLGMGEYKGNILTSMAIMGLARGRCIKGA